MRNRITACLLAAAIVCTLAGCDNKENPTDMERTTEKISVEVTTTETPVTEESDCREIAESTAEEPDGREMTEFTAEESDCREMAKSTAEEPDSREMTESSASEEDADVITKDTTGEETSAVKVNQIGYSRKDKKIAVFSDLQESDTTFTVVNLENNKVVFEGKMSQPKRNDPAGEMNCVGDFSELKEDGIFKVVSKMGVESKPFAIDEQVYGDTLDNVVRMFYLQRCGQALEEEYAGEFFHGECHKKEAVIDGTEKTIEVSGGWHDGNGYGRYVVSGAKAAADLMLAYEKNPKVFSDGTGIAESGNGIPDVLDEVRYELEWMLRMQDNESGGVYHQVTCKKSTDAVMPQNDTGKLVVAPVTREATGDFAAVMAMASRIYINVDAEFAKRCIGAAEYAWMYLDENKPNRYVKAATKNLKWKYVSETSIDEMFWAAAELCKATDDVIYLESAMDSFDQMKYVGGVGWQDVAGYGAYAILTSEAIALDEGDFEEEIETAFLSYAETTLFVSKRNPYMVRKARQYERGSNMGVANSGMLLCLVNELEERDEYVEYAKYHLNYLFGVNATGYCFVTGAGTNSPLSPYHKQSIVLGKAMPGMLVAGPDSDLDDAYAQTAFIDTPAAKCYEDNVECVSCNGVSICQNSALAYLLAVLEY